jgi:hypothetical protein
MKKVGPGEKAKIAGDVETVWPHGDLQVGGADFPRGVAILLVAGDLCFGKVKADYGRYDIRRRHTAFSSASSKCSYIRRILAGYEQP